MSLIKIIDWDQPARFRKPAPEWRDMESAPRDGTEIILLTTTGVVSAWFDPPRIVHDYFDGDDTEGCQWVCYDDKFTEIVEWFGENDYGDGSAGIRGWMPLPKAPDDIQDTNI